MADDDMPDPAYVALPGSERTPVAAAVRGREIDPGERAEVTIIVRRRAALPRAADGLPVPLGRDDLREQHGADPADLDLVGEVLAGLGTGIAVTARDPGSRRMTVAGPLGALADAFGASLSLVTSPGPHGIPVTYRHREGGLRLPAPLDGVVSAVLGLDTRPQAHPHYRRTVAEAAQVSYAPPQVAVAYQFPPGTTGAGQMLAIVELGGGFGQADLDAYFSGLGIATPSVTAVGIDGASNVAGQDPGGADGEVLLDIEVTGAVAPGARQVVYFAPNTDQGFVDAVSAAAHATPTPAAISISWGESEDAWTAQGRDALDQAIADAAALGITVCAAAGDNGSGDGVGDGKPHADFPASSPHALGCGGTTMHTDPTTGLVSTETVWNDGPGGGSTGGGVSEVFALPTWQSTAGVPPRLGQGSGRGVPDVAGNADPVTGYQVLVDGQRTVVGGTSAVAPLWAALTVRLAESARESFGIMQRYLYAGVRPGTAVAGLRDITSGNNGAYQAGPGWDACTGLGTPIGTALLGRLTGSG